MAEQLYFRIKAAQTYRVSFALSLPPFLCLSPFVIRSLPLSPWLAFSHALCLCFVVICIKRCAEKCATFFAKLTMCTMNLMNIYVMLTI